MAKADSKVQRRAGAARKSPQAVRAGRRNPLGSIRETFSELRKVTWPTPRQTQRLTIIVIIISGLVGAFLGGIDLVFGGVVRNLLGF